MTDEKTGWRMSSCDFIPEEAYEHFRAARDEMRKGFKSLFPVEFLKHRRAARREALLAFRSVLDGAIERLNAEE